ncbi:MAG: endonuclease/exonuclease/phosphatase family protein [Actinomycetaceae bacterium]|nr:endonuclease/exonuclease/phosphatase family protein [Actinomycetaceae bacterium]
MRVMTLNLQSGLPNESWNADDAYFGLDERLGGRPQRAADVGQGTTGQGTAGATGQDSAADLEVDASVAREIIALKAAGAEVGRFLALASSAAKVAQTAPDILAMQEVRETPQRSMIEAFAAQCNMPHTRFAAARRAHSQLLMRVRGQASIGYGIALLSRHPIEAAKTLRLPSWKNPFRRDPKRQKGIAGFYFRTEEQRMAILALVRTPEPIVVASAHLTARREQNLEQLEYLERKMRAFASKHGVPDAPLLLLGDLNLKLDSVRQATGLDVLAEALTFPESKPRTQIDHVLGRGLRSEGEADVVRLPIADHLGLITQVQPTA